MQESIGRKPGNTEDWLTVLYQQFHKRSMKLELSCLLIRVDRLREGQTQNQKLCRYHANTNNGIFYDDRTQSGYSDLFLEC